MSRLEPRIDMKKREEDKNALAYWTQVAQLTRTSFCLIAQKTGLRRKCWLKNNV